jgi:hypothetical protein
MFLELTDKNEIRTLRGQLLLMALAFGGALVLAMVMAWRSDFFHRFIEEKYRPLPAHLQPLDNDLRRGTLSAKRISTLSKADQVALYESWVQQNRPSRQAPLVLVQEAPELFLARAEQTLVCGNTTQKERALLFYEYSQSLAARPYLERARAWFFRRKEEQWSRRIEQAMQKLNKEVDPHGR